tara:strand:- start:12393 stop:12563 length:171 start_codon:yes stop_codon:yes gene_type:complete
MPKVKNTSVTSRKKTYRRMMQSVLGATKTDAEKRSDFQIQIQMNEGGGTFSKIEKI